MNQIIEDIRKLFADSAFQDEQHVRFSLVGRICQKLGWNIWNPKEFYTEYPVKRYPPHEITKELRGRVDIALLMPEKHFDIAEVFIEVKTPYKLQTELVSGENQLNRYSWWDKSAISVLTDGIIWRFYLPSIGGAFENSLFSELDILHDDIDSICLVFEQVLKRDNFRKQAVEAAEIIYEEICRIKILSEVKAVAKDIAQKTGISRYTLALQLLRNQHNFNMDIAEIERLWDKKLPKVTQAPSFLNPINKNVNVVEKSKPEESAEPPKYFDIDTQTVHTKRLTNYRFTKLQYVRLAGNDPFEIKTWRKLKKYVYDFIFRSNPSLSLTGALRSSHDPKQYTDPVKLQNGSYIEVNLGASETVAHCRRAMEAAGFDPDNDLVIAYTFTAKRKDI